MWISDGLSLASYDLPSLEPSDLVQIANGLRDVAVSFDQQEVWAAHPTGVAIVVPGGPQLDGVPLDDPRGLVFSAGDFAYVGNVDAGLGGQVVVIDTGSHSAIDVIAVASQPTSTALSPDDAQLYVTDADASAVIVIDTASREIIGSVGTGIGPQHCAVSADGTRLYAASVSEITVIDTASLTALGTYVPGVGALNRMAVSPDGQLLYVAGVSGLHIIEAQTGDVIESVPLPFLSDVALTDDGAFAIVTGTIEARIVVIDTASLQVVAERQHPTPSFLDVRTTAIFADGFESGDTGGWEVTLPGGARR